MYSGFLLMLFGVNWARKADNKRLKIQLQVSRGGTFDTQPWHEAETRKRTTTLETNVSSNAGPGL